MSDLSEAEAEWRPWIERACAAVGVNPADVDVHAIHALTKIVAHELARPMAPVSSFIAGLAIGAAGPDVDREAIYQALAATTDD